MGARRVIEISGAGPAGLAASLAAACIGGRVCVSERRGDVGARFHGDFQGLENWTVGTDVLDELGALGIDAGFDWLAVREVTVFDPDARPRRFRSVRPLYYLVRRGGEPGCLDHALKIQAMEAGVELRFNHTVRRLPRGGIVTEGPHRADAIAAGFLFETDMADGAYAAVSDELAPKGYAYLLVWNGRGTVATCMFRDFHRVHECARRTVAFFETHAGLRMRAPRRFGGTGNFFLPRSAHKGNILYAGEAAGFQDPLFGFGIRSALLSGARAGRALALGAPQDYERWWRRRLKAVHQTAAAHRWIYERLGDRGYRAVIARYPEGTDVREWMHRAYRPRWRKRLWYHLAARRRHRPLLRTDTDCDCSWCRCAEAAAAPRP
jgi:flavin-dependent dehydrogenase